MTWIVKLGVPVLSLALFAGCGLGVESAEGAGAAFPVAQPAVRTVHLEQEYVADIKASRHAEIRARFAGLIEEVYVDEGQRVEKDQPLFSVNSRALQQELAVARATLKGAQASARAAELEVENTRLLVERKVVSAVELAVAESNVGMAQATLEEARARVDLAQLLFDQATVRAPFEGVVNRIPKRAGSLVAAEEMLTSITDASSVYAYFHLNEREALQYFTAGKVRETEVSLRLADGTLFDQFGVIDAAENEFDPATGNLALRATFPNPDGVLRHGSSGKIVTRNAVADALLVPQRSTFDVQGNVYVYVVDDQDIAHSRQIATPSRVDGWFVVDAGITSAERFVVEGLQRVRDGQRIAPQVHALDEAGG